MGTLSSFHGMRTKLRMKIRRNLTKIVRTTKIFLLRRIRRLFRRPLKNRSLINFLKQSMIRSVLNTTLIGMVHRFSLRIRGFLRQIIGRRKIRRVANGIFLLTNNLIRMKATIPRRTRLFRHSTNSLLGSLIQSSLIGIHRHRTLITMNRGRKQSNTKGTPRVIASNILMTLFLLLLLINLRDTGSNLLRLLHHLLSNKLRHLRRNNNTLLLLNIGLPIRLLALLNNNTTLRLLNTLSLRLTLISTMIIRRLIRHRIRLNFNNTLGPLLIKRLRIPPVLLLYLLRRKNSSLLNSTLFRKFRVLFFNEDENVNRILRNNIRHQNTLMGFFTRRVHYLTSSMTLIRVRLTLIIRKRIYANIQDSLSKLYLYLTSKLRILRGIRRLLQHARRIKGILRRRVTLGTRPRRFFKLSLPKSTRSFLHVRQSRLPFLILTSSQRGIRRNLSVHLTLLNITLTTNNIL